MSDDFDEDADDLENASAYPAAGVKFITPKFIGIPEVRGLLAKHPEQVVAALQKVVSHRALQMKYAFIEAMDYEYTSINATGRLARSITYRTLKREGGVELRFYIRPFRELTFVTSLMGGYFRLFPVRPFEIVPRDGGSLWIRKDLPGGGRANVRRIATDKPVLWGKYTGGFSRDILKDVGEEEERFFVEDVQNAMRDELAQLRTTLSGRNTQ